MAPAQWKELNKWNKRRIERQRWSISHGNILHELNIAHQTIFDFLKRFNELSFVENLPWVGRPWATSDSYVWYLRYTILKGNTHILLAELCNVTNTQVLVSTIHCHFNEDKIWKWKAAEDAELIEEHAKNWLKWAREHKQ